MEGVDLRTHRTNKLGYTTLIMAAADCSTALLEIILPRSDAHGTTADGYSAAQLAREIGRTENAAYIEAYIASQKEASAFDDIPIPPRRARGGIDLR